MTNKERIVLHNEISKWEHLTIKKLNKSGYFYSNVSGILSTYSPEDVCKVIKEDYNLDVTFISCCNKYAIFDEKHKNYEEMGNMFNEHFNANAEFKSE